MALMKLLTRLVLGGFDARRHFQCRRSIHLVPTGCGRPRGLSDTPATTAAAKDPSWVLLTTGDCVRWNGNSSVPSAKTVAEARTSMGHRLSVWFHLVAPPAMSRLYYNCWETTAEDKYVVNVIAAHGDSVLLLVTHTRFQPSCPYEYDHFVYRSGGTARRPSLSLLPDLKALKYHDEGIRGYNCRPLLARETGILQLGNNGEFAVARIDGVLSELSGGHGMANLCVFRSGSTQWEYKRSVPIVHGEDEKLIGSLSGVDMALPVGDQFMCWVGHHNSFILCDLSDEASPKLRHVPLPGMPYDRDYYTDDLRPLTDSHTVGVAGTNAVRFVAIEPRCCCGGIGRCSCPRSRHAFTVTTWTLNLTMDEPIVWVKDSVLDCEELWAFQGYEGIPRRHLQSPIVSLDDPDVVWFRLVSHEEKKAWMIQVDTRRKAVLAAVVQSTTSSWRSYSYNLRQAKLQ